MKKQEAKDLILAQISAGISREETIETIASQEKIGTEKPTEESAAALYDSVNEGIEGGEKEVVKTISKLPIYEKWNVKVNAKGEVVEKLKKLKEVSMNEDAAETLNKAALSAREYTVKYFKK